ncbi:GMP synthase [Aureibaculum marinum]|uniref:GMP synthase n=1 Tax=Aureibaculum marinum TaxID=2487930 RepID=A0A3N4NQJ8_9FLAO|nr:GMP synthase [Aureibaculum marinum]RPD94390.1 GMP synthase [Aureibaculum marinum]
MSIKFKIAILDMNAGVPNEGMRCIKMLVSEFLTQDHVHGEFKVFDVRIEGKLPKLDKYDIFISSGGPGSPLVVGEQWEKDYFRFLDSLLSHNLFQQQKKHLFLICHSFQLACLHWDIAKVTKRRSTSFGILPIFKTEGGFSEPLFEGLDDPFYAVDSRDYQVVMPNESKLSSLEGKILCREKIRPHVPLRRAVMAIRFTKEIFGTQFHPEADAEGMMRYFQREEKRDIVIKKYGKKKYLNMIDRLDDDDKIVRTHSIIIPKFLAMAAENCKQYKLASV